MAQPERLRGHLPHNHLLLDRLMRLRHDGPDSDPQNHAREGARLGQGREGRRVNETKPDKDTRAIKLLPHHLYATIRHWNRLGKPNGGTPSFLHRPILLRKDSKL